MKFAVIQMLQYEGHFISHCLLRNVKTLQQVLISTFKVASKRTDKHPGMAFNPSTILHSAFNIEVIFLVSLSGVFQLKCRIHLKKVYNAKIVRGHVACQCRRILYFPISPLALPKITRNLYFFSFENTVHW